MRLLLDRCDDTYLAVTVEDGAELDDSVKADSYITLSQSGPGHQILDPEAVQDDDNSSEISVLKVQLRQAEETAQKVQIEVTPMTTLSLKNISFPGSVTTGSSSSVDH